MGACEVGESHDPAEPVLVNPPGSRRQPKLTWRTDSEFIPVEVEPNRPPLHTV